MRLFGTDLMLLHPPLYARAKRGLRSVAARGREKASGRAGPGEPLAGA
jgi:hypothetical protein